MAQRDLFPLNIRFGSIMIRVYTPVVCDLFHVGHLNMFRQARELGDYLIVGIHSDADAESYKRTPIFKENDRYELIRNCRLVDEVIEAAPLKVTEELLDKYKIDVVVHGDDEEQAQYFQVAIDRGIMKYVKYTHGISSTAIIQQYL
tara:strand:+ start:66 stop:503 length:438 start_codon:yes stop_codon:yes gene_type:complete